MAFHFYIGLTHFHGDQSGIILTKNVAKHFPESEGCLVAPAVFKTVAGLALLALPPRHDGWSCNASGGALSIFSRASVAVTAEFNAENAEGRREKNFGGGENTSFLFPLSAALRVLCVLCTKFGQVSQDDARR